MSLRVALLINFLLLVDKADSKKGEWLFVILMEQSLTVMQILRLAGTLYTKVGRYWSMSVCEKKKKSND